LNLLFFFFFQTTRFETIKPNKHRMTLGFAVSKRVV
jgi:hypothetical protein